MRGVGGRLGTQYPLRQILVEQKLRAGVLHQKVSKPGWRTIHIKGVVCSTVQIFILTDCKFSWGQVLKRTPMQPTSREPLRSMGIHGVEMKHQMNGAASRNDYMKLVQRPEDLLIVA